jgi:hypothetical protein
MKEHADVIRMRVGQEKPLELVRLATVREVERMRRLLEDVAPMRRAAIHGENMTGTGMTEEGDGTGDLTERAMEFKVEGHGVMRGRLGVGGQISAEKRGLARRRYVPL